MGFFRQFDEFDPQTGVAPDHPFSHLPAIVSRARALLENRTRDEIDSAAHNADFFIEEYFRIEKDNYIRRLLDHGGRELGYLQEEERNEAGIRRLLDNWPSEADEPPPHIPTPENTSEVTALKVSIEWYTLDDDDDFPGGHEFEYFAVLALWLVADAMEWLKWSSDVNYQEDSLREAFAQLPNALNNVPEIMGAFQTGMEAHKSIGGTDTDIRFSLAGERALYAMDAVCYAEHLHATEKQAKELVKLQIDVYQVAQKTDSIVEEKVKEKISLKGKNASIKRHEKSAELKNMAKDIYFSKKWRTFSQATQYIYPILQTRGREIGFVFSEDRGEQTVSEWLRAIRKQADV